MFGILLAIIIVGWVAASILGTQAYFFGEQSKPIHERNWDSDGFENIAKLVTGRETDFNERTYSFSGDAYTSNSANS
ncbi:MAG: photosystem II protein, Psb35-related [Leptolyngbyaceae cyanobacterium]